MISYRYESSSLCPGASSILSGCFSRSAGSVTDRPVAVGAGSEKQPVLVELFTSEGCSSCPPADQLLTTLANDQSIAGAEIITLEFHVDYWDNPAWKDRFSSAEYTRRQTAYARQFGIGSIYTPQMVVDGVGQFVGSNRYRAADSITEAAALPKAPVALEIRANKMQVSISGLREHGDATIYLGVSESKLVTQVDGGENSGNLLEHTSVVRGLIAIGSVAAGETAARVEWPMPTNTDWKIENLKYVVFVQENSGLKGLAVRQVSPR